QRLERFPRILHAVSPAPEGKRRRTTLEALVAAADGAGTDEPLTFIAAVSVAVGAARRVAPVHHEAIAQARPVKQIDLLDEGPVQVELPVEANGAGGAVIPFTDVDRHLAPARPKGSIRRSIILVRRPAEYQSPVSMPPH